MYIQIKSKQTNQQQQIEVTYNGMSDNWDNYYYYYYSICCIKAADIRFVYYAYI